jgi:hypothetical protein
MKKLLFSISVLISGCGGGGGDPTTPVIPIEPIICSVPAKLYGEVTYPSNYNGNFPIPKANSRLPSTVVRSMALLDATPLGAGPFRSPSDPCKDEHTYALNLWKESLTRLQLNNSNRVLIYGWAGYDDLTKSTWTLNKSSFIPTVDSDLKFIVSEANKRNLEVYYSQQFDYTDLNGKTLDPNTISKEDFKKTLAAYHVFIGKQAKFAQSIGIAGFGVDWSYPVIPKIHSRHHHYDPEFRTLWLNQMYLIIDDIKKVYSGKLVIGAVETAIDAKIAEKVDAMAITPKLGQLGLTSEENKNLTVDLLRGKYKTEIKNIYADISNQLNGAPVNLPVIWNLQVQSKYDYYVTSWTESVFCVIFGGHSCVQKTYITDFSVQAIGYEAMLGVVNEQVYFRNNAVNIDAGYWLTDDMTPNLNNPHPGFPNLHQSVRNKPSEAIVRSWFSKG